MNTICSTKRRRLQFTRLSLEIATHDRTIVNPTLIGITIDHGHRVVNTVTTITTAMTTATAPTTEGDQTTVVTAIAMTTIERTMTTMGMTTTGMTGTNHDIHETIGVTLIEVRETIDRTGTIVVENLLNPNCTALFPTMSRGPTRLTKGLTPRLHESPRTDHTQCPTTDRSKTPAMSSIMADVQQVTTRRKTQSTQWPIQDEVRQVAK